MAARDNVVEMPIKELVIERVFDAPRERVFDVFTQPEHMQKWWGPKGVSNAVAEFEARPGGKIFIAERALDGATIYIAGVVREIERPSRVLYAIHFADADRKRVAPPAHSGLGDTWDDEIVTLVTFSTEGRRTRMTIRTLSGFTAEWGERAVQVDPRRRAGYDRPGGPRGRSMARLGRIEAAHVAVPTERDLRHERDTARRRAPRRDVRSGGGARLGV